MDRWTLYFFFRSDKIYLFSITSGLLFGLIYVYFPFRIIYHVVHQRFTHFRVAVCQRNGKISVVLSNWFFRRPRGPGITMHFICWKTNSSQTKFESNSRILSQHINQSSLNDSRIGICFSFSWTHMCVRSNICCCSVI